MKKNIPSEFEALANYFSPKVICEVNDQYLKIAKILGDKVPWHNHQNEDELFYIKKGTLLMEIENQKPFTMKEGDVYVVKKGIQHRVSSNEECHIILIETKSTQHTGEVQTSITKSIQEQL